MTVVINTGKGFTKSYNWNGGSEKLPLSYDMSINLNTGANFTVQIPLFAFFVPLGTIIINPGIGINIVNGKTEARMIDINGDGYTDQVFADKDGKLRANLNRTGKTNLLKKVKRPLGGSFEISYKREGNTKKP